MSVYIPRWKYNLLKRLQESGEANNKFINRIFDAYLLAHSKTDFEAIHRGELVKAELENREH